jgi:hypothetical protein
MGSEAAPTQNPKSPDHEKKPFPENYLFKQIE